MAPSKPASSALRTESSRTLGGSCSCEAWYPMKTITPLSRQCAAGGRGLHQAAGSGKGRDLLKQVRTHLVETARPLMEAMIGDVTGVKVISLHQDISTVTGEEIILFTLSEPPKFRDVRKQ